MRAVVDLERSLTFERPLMVVLDDAHHADAFSMRVFARAFGCLSSEPAMFLIATTDESLELCLGPVTKHPLPRLDIESTRRLARLILDSAGSLPDEQSLESLVRASGGHPVLLREAALAWTRGIGEARDASIEAILMRRISGLSEDARSVLLSTLVLAECASASLVLGSCGIDAMAAERALGELEREQIVVCGADGTIAAHHVWVSAASVLFPKSSLIVRNLRVAHLLEGAAVGSAVEAEQLLASAARFEHGGDNARAARALTRGGAALRERALAPAAYAAFSKAATLAPASSDFERCMFESIVAAHRGGLVTEASALVSRYSNRLRFSARLGPWEQDEISVIGLEAKQAGLDHAVDSQACLLLLEQPGLTDLQRLRVALVGARWADQSYDSDSLDRIVALILDTPRDSDACALVASQIEMVHAIAARDLKRARQLAERDLARFGAERPRMNHIRAMLNNRVPYWFDCDFGRVGQVIDRVRTVAQRYPSTFWALRVEDVYATQCIDLMHLDEARDVLSATRGRAREFGYVNLERNLDELSDRLCVAEGSVTQRMTPQTVSSLVDRARTHVRFQTFAICNATVFAARAEQFDALERILPHLVNHWELARSTCPFDYACVALCIALRALGQNDASASFIADYFRSSRTASHPPSPFVLRLASEFGLDLARSYPVNE